MNKKEIQKRVLYKGKPIPLEDFTWDEKTKTFSSNLDSLVLDFAEIDNCTFKTGSYCTFDTGSYCTFDVGERCVIIRRDIFEIIEPKGETKLLPYTQKGYIEKLEGEEYFQSKHNDPNLAYTLLCLRSFSQ